ncbi:MAG: FeoB-associated Cys-rich membrane protein [Lachnospiraceae bacterium]
MGTAVTLVIVLGLVCLAVRSMIKDKKNGKSIQCGGNCAECSKHCH